MSVHFVYNIYIILSQAMINSQSMSYAQKCRLWKQQKQQKFKQLSRNRSQLFNYFLHNNDLFGFIDRKDVLDYNLNMFKLMDQQSNVFFAAFAAVVIVDRLVLNRFFPAIRFKEWRLTANVIKYAGWPYFLFQLTDYYYLSKYHGMMYDIQSKYNFGFGDYIRGNRVFQRALKVDRLQQLLQKRQKFDWDGVPQLTQDQ